MLSLSLLAKLTKKVNFFSGFALLFLIVTALSVSAQTQNGKELYNKLKTFELTGGMVDVKDLVLKRDRAEMTFTGTFYFMAPIDGKVTGAVFIGSGKFHSDAPPGDFEKVNLKRLLGTEAVDSEFQNCIMRFSDDTWNIIGKNKKDGTASPEAIKMAAEYGPRTLKETGINISSRLAASILNSSDPGIFFATFDGKSKRFSYVFDPQTRILGHFFNLTAGEKGVIFEYDEFFLSPIFWTAFPSLEDYARGAGEYSDKYDLVDIDHYDMEFNVADPKNKVVLKTKIKMTARYSGLSVIPFTIGESLNVDNQHRLKKQLHVKSANINGGEIAYAQEDWEGGLSVFLPKPAQQGEKIEVEVVFEGDFMVQPRILPEFSYPISTTEWYPRHGYLDRSTYEFKFIHNKKDKIACVGVRTGESPYVPESLAANSGKDLMMTAYSLKHPIDLATFAIGPFERHSSQIKWDADGSVTPIEFNSIPSGKFQAGAGRSTIIVPIKEDFILAEINNAARYFQALFGKYPYDNYGATYHPFGYGQGFPTMIIIPSTGNARRGEFSFIAHETAHQWWGNIVAWRSYRDQWLSEGFAEYSGILYTSFRSKPDDAMDLLEFMRKDLRDPPYTLTGQGKGTLNDVGPIILGFRVNTTKTYGAYQALAYSKGGLVLRMLHFLFSDPVSGDDKPFYNMMNAFVEKFRNGKASTDDFRVVANQHFAETPIAKKYQLKNLNWFFKQWVYETGFPSYKLEYQITDQGGATVVSGNVHQLNVDDKFFMPMPVVFKLPGGKMAKTTIAAYGPKQPFSIKLPSKPEKVELDPDKWVISEKTE